MAGDSAMRTRRASSTGSVVAVACSAIDSMMVRMSRTCTDSSSSSCSTFWNDGDGNHLGHDFFDQFRGQAGHVFNQFLGLRPAQQLGCLDLHQV